MMKLKHLESELEDLEGFTTPNIQLEQFVTTPELAAKMLHIIQMTYQDITGKMIADLGCGTGMLTIGASLLGAGLCVGIDIDENALDVCQKNVLEKKCEFVDLVQADVLNSLDERWHKAFDTVILNPPFGTKNNRGTDMLFLRTALSLARTAVYSLHKSSTREHLRKVSESWNVNFESLFEITLDLPKTYKKNIHESLNIKVDLLRFTFPKRNKNKRF